MMTQIRCMYFDESGNPRAGGCRSNNCNFIHPGNPAWEKALIPRNTPRDRGSGRGGHFPGRGRGRGSDSSNSFASGWVTGGSDNAAKAQNSSWETEKPKDSTKASDSGWGSGSGWDDAGSGWGSNDNSTGGWGESSAGAWGDSSGGTWGSTGWGDSTTGSKESSGGGWGSAGWGNSTTGSKESSGGGWGTSGEVTQPAQEKRDDQEKEKFKSPTIPPPRPVRRTSAGWGDEEDSRKESRPTKMTGSNKLPVTNTKWNGRGNAIVASSNPEPPEKPFISPLQTSSLGSWTPGQPSALPSASRSEGGVDVEKWLQRDKAMSMKSRSRSPSVSTVTVTASTANRKRKFGISDLEKQQEYWREFIRVFDRAIRAKAGFDKAETERHSWVRTQKSTTYERIGEAGRNRLDGHRAALETARKTHSDKLTRAINELAEAGETLKSGMDYDQRYDIEDQVTEYLKEVGAWLEDIRSLLIANTHQHPPITDGPAFHENDLPEETCADTDGLDPLRSRLDKLEELLEELRTAVTLESSGKALATINSIIDQKIDAMREARVRAKELLADVPPPQVIIPSEAMGYIEDVSRQATYLSSAMEKPVHEVAHLLVHQDEMKKTYTSFKAENEELRESIAKLAEASFDAVSESRRTPPPAEPAVKIMFQELRVSVDKVVQEILSREVVPAVTQLSDACRLENQRIHREIFETIWDRVDPALKLTEVVNRWVTRFDGPAS
ncbi:hypothetical protein K503DRAFT_196307 [Rhizopogon vinicolor AM-OR11-026]|uniref:C3H1-type domain-containing protein n=1 Tax=Rhizopogon vinicolor AM-OR11-026 TaxID=1314800 RepID=A0A1B7NIQ8_9AGAM|nr:hypothetical protein K503DRAFT_196307 [Rhizopogon vinicolor AM-OR11-026]